MAMVTEIDGLHGAGPTATAITAMTYNRSDDDTTTSTEIPTPTATGTNFSFAKSMQINITTTNSLTMTNVKVGCTVAQSATGQRLWARTDHAVGSYVQATAIVAATSDANSTAPVIPVGGNNTNVAILVAIGSASVYAAGGFSSTGRVGDLVETAFGIDNGNTAAGTAVAGPTVRFSWTEG